MSKKKSWDKRMGPPKLSVVPSGRDSDNAETGERAGDPAGEVGAEAAAPVPHVSVSPPAALAAPDRAEAVSRSDRGDRADRADKLDKPDRGEAADRAPDRASGLPSNIASLPSADRREKLRVLEAILFAAAEPLDEAQLKTYLKDGEAVGALLEELKGFYAGRGVNLVRVAGKWAFRTAEDLAYLLERHAVEERRLSKAALETLAIIAYHQPVTRAEIEEIRGVSTSKGTIDVLLECGWIRPRGRRRAPGRPLTYGTTDTFLSHFSLDSIKDLPGLAELKGAGLLDGNLPPGFSVPDPTDVAALMPDELPLEAGEEEGEQAEMALDLPESEERDNPES